MAHSARSGKSREALGRDWITRATERASAGLARDGVDVTRLRRWGFESAARDADVLARHNRRYSLELPFGGIKDQAQSGNCWLFAPVVLARAAAIKRGSITGTESFSETHLYFFNLLEQASATLDDVRLIAERKDSLDGDTLRQRLSQEVMGLADGGEWEWAFNLIEKYGLVPSQRMPETASSKATKALGVDLHERFARAARAIRNEPRRYDAIREQALRDVVRILVAHLGAPPPHVKHAGQRLLPTQYAERIGFRASEWRVAISNPLLPFERVYERRASAITTDAPRYNLRRLNVPQRRLRALVRASLESGYAVGFSADVDRNDIDHVRGIMHPAIFNRARAYGARLIRDLPRREDIFLGVASSKHAMAIAGLDATRRGSSPIKYRVVNSWGPDMGDRGIYHMYAEWFEENVFKLAVHESVLDAGERAAYEHPESAPGGNFY
ncbi:MAG TPA: C1 family peptidase [Vicinamibacteria bacterium]|nr:C1 family peptidase [Vicinamibacteria bacterium]